jgi:hypothetical protein
LPRGPVVALDIIVNVVADKKNEAQAQPAFERLDGRPNGSRASFRRPSSSLAVRPFRPAVVGIGAQGCQRESKPGHVISPFVMWSENLAKTH